jgi:hypothetical protein
VKNAITFVLTITKQNNIMTTLTNTTKTKAVKISNSAPQVFNAVYVQIYNNEEDVVQLKTFKTMQGATKWAKTILN